MMHLCISKGKGYTAITLYYSSYRTDISISVSINVGIAAILYVVIDE
jgi:hypothetical protein